jgi:DNA-binding protein HU-beta
VHVTKQEFVERVAQKSGLGRREAGEAVDAVIEAITEALKNREEVAFTGFGKFTTQHRAARQGVNPRNPSEKVQIPAAGVPKFSAGSSLKQAVRSGGGGSDGGMM